MAWTTVNLRWLQLAQQFYRHTMALQHRNTQQPARHTQEVRVGDIRSSPAALSAEAGAGADASMEK